MASSEIPLPEWVNSGKVTDRGQDLLGLRTPVQNIGYFCMDGVTTITPAIRYVSIRTLIAKIFIESQNADDWKAFREFAAAFEAAVAFGNLMENVQQNGILGTNEATRRLDEGNGPLLLERLVEQLGVNIYARASDQLHITFLPEQSSSGIPGVTTERGTPIADALFHTLSRTPLGPAFANGQIPHEPSREDILEFGRAFRLDSFEPEERRLLIDSLIPANPLPNERNRLASYALLLTLAESRQGIPTQRDLFEAAVIPSPNLASELTEILDGWLLYLIRDLLSVVHEFVLEEVNLELGRRSSENVGLHESKVIIGAILSRQGSIEQLLSRLGILIEPGGFSKMTLAELRDALLASFQRGEQITSTNGLKRWSSGITELDLIRAASGSDGAARLALAPLAWLLIQNRLANLPLESEEMRLLSRNGVARIGIKEVVLPKVNEAIAACTSPMEFAAQLAFLTVDQHLTVAWSRFSTDPTKLVAVITSDGDKWAFRKEFAGGRTESRVSQAVGWLRQLALIDEGGITSTGREILDRALSTLRSGGNP